MKRLKSRTGFGLTMFNYLISRNLRSSQLYRELEDRFDFSYSHFNCFVTGSRIPTVKIAVIIADALDIDRLWLLKIVLKDHYEHHKNKMNKEYFELLENEGDDKMSRPENIELEEIE